MLNQLHITNFAIVEHVDLEFLPGMTVVTGATGAGKSIMLDGLGLALGDRADSSQLGTHGPRSEIHAAFDVTGNEDALGWLRDHDFEDFDASQIILRRVVSKEGPSRAYINGLPCTVTDLRAFGDLLIDIHAQHDHQSLLRRPAQRRLLDDFSGRNDLVTQVAGLARAVNQLRSRYAELQKSSAERSGRQQLLRYQFDELTEIGLHPDEISQLEVERKRLAGTERSRTDCEAILLILHEAEPSVTDQLSRAIDRVLAIDDPLLANTLELLTSSRIQLDEAASELRGFVDHLEEDPERLHQVEARLAAIYECARKHRVPAAELPALLDSISNELNQISVFDERLSQLEESIGSAEANYHACARELSRDRTQAALRLDEEVTARLHQLEMRGARFKAELTSDSTAVREYGYEDVEFMICTLVGQPLRPLTKVASGGELSRISLAIQVATADTNRVPTLVFDEVDVGIGGSTAEVVGAMLRHIGSKGQVICVTHLAQVAAQGHQHLRVSRQDREDETIASIDALDETERIMELARMLGGVQITDPSLAHAEAMYRAAQSG